MLGVFGVIKDKFRVRYDDVCIDNWVFQLHYRATTIIFCIATILVTAREFIGEHIKCINDMRDGGFDKVIESFCFFTSTFSVVEDGGVDHFGLAEYGIGSTKAIRRHTYYQWVPYMFFQQAIMFYLTHILWKSREGGRIKHLVSGLSYSKYALSNKPLTVGDRVIPTKEQKKKHIQYVKHKFLVRLELNKSWGRWLIVCEVLNVAHILLEVFIVHKFLGNQFYLLGPNFLRNSTQTLDLVFPKMTKCTFHKYGPSGTMQNHDALCMMALNIVIEKIYVFLWFWFAALFLVSCSILVWRILSSVFFARCMCLNQYIFGRGKLYHYHLNMVIRRCSYSDWLLLKYLAKNLDNMTFRELFREISDELEEKEFMTKQTFGGSSKFE